MSSVMSQADCLVEIMLPVDIRGDVDYLVWPRENPMVRKTPSVATAPRKNKITVDSDQGGQGPMLALRVCAFSRLNRGLVLLQTVSILTLTMSAFCVSPQAQHQSPRHSPSTNESQNSPEPTRVFLRQHTTTVVVLYQIVSPAYHVATYAIPMSIEADSVTEHSHPVSFAASQVVYKWCPLY